MTIKMTMLLKRADGVSPEEFAAHHREVHAELMRTIPEARQHLVRYLQTHRPAGLDVDTVPLADFDGTAELWFDSVEGLEAVMGSETFRTTVADDEPAFLDPTATLVLVGEPVDVVGDPRSESAGELPLAAAPRDVHGTLPRGINHVGLTVPDLDEAARFLEAAFDARFSYESLGAQDEPRGGPETEHQLGLPAGAQVVRQRMVQIGTGPGLEMFEVRPGDQHEARPAAGLADLGLQHVSVFVDDVAAALERAVRAGGQALSQPHGNSPHEDTEGNASVYVRAPWGTLVELQALPAGHWYDDEAEARAWVPPLRRTPLSAR